jgi:hypothetical protein
LGTKVEAVFLFANKDWQIEYELEGSRHLWRFTGRAEIYLRAGNVFSVVFGRRPVYVVNHTVGQVFKV